MNSALKTSIDFLPEDKQAEIQSICELLVREFKPAMVILFGSYARNTWVREDITEEDGHRVVFRSDYDILVVTVKDLNPATNKHWHKTQSMVWQLPLSAPVSVIQHSIGFVNNELKEGGYFFTDIVKEGIMLYNSGQVKLGEPGNVDPEKVKQRAKDDFKYWFDSADEFLIDYKHAFERGSYNKAAFELHQAVERLFTAFFLVFTGYKGKSHDLKELNQKAIDMHREFASIFPQDTKEQSQRFTLLVKAYIDSRYKKSYHITKEDLDYLGPRVEALRELVKKVCEERLGE